MEVFVGILFILGFGVVWYLVPKGIAKGISAGVSGARKAVAAQQGATLSGQNSVYTEIEFTVPIQSALLFDKIEETLALPTGGLLFRAGRDDESVTYAYGSTRKMDLVYVIMLEEHSDSECRGTAQAVRWHEDVGFVTTSGTVTRLHKHVRSAIEGFGGTYTVQQNTKTGKAT
jgi:hypothetical protein